MIARTTQEHLDVLRDQVDGLRIGPEADPFGWCVVWVLDGERNAAHGRTLHQALRHASRLVAAAEDCQKP